MATMRTIICSRKPLQRAEGYVNAMVPNEPAFSYFPPGYAFLLSPFRIFTDSIVFLKVLNGACLWGALLLWWHILVRLWQATDPDSINLERHRLLAAVLLLFPVMSPQLLRFFYDDDERNAVLVDRDAGLLDARSATAGGISHSLGEESECIYYWRC